MNQHSDHPPKHWLHFWRTRLAEKCQKTLCQDTLLWLSTEIGRGATHKNWELLCLQGEEIFKRSGVPMVDSWFCARQMLVRFNVIPHLKTMDDASSLVCSPGMNLTQKLKYRILSMINWWLELVVIGIVAAPFVSKWFPYCNHRLCMVWSCNSKPPINHQLTHSGDMWGLGWWSALNNHPMNSQWVPHQSPGIVIFLQQGIQPHLETRWRTWGTPTRSPKRSSLGQLVSHAIDTFSLDPRALQRTPGGTGI